MEALIDCGAAVLDHDPSLLTWQEDVVPTSYSQFQPRPNRPEVYDQQKAFGNRPGDGDFRRMTDFLCGWQGWKGWSSNGEAKTNSSWP